jgi:translation initiation factor 2D
LNSYIAANNLVNANDQAYINLDELLYSCLSAKSKGKAKGKDVEPESELSRFMKRDELTRGIIGKMQSWYAIRAEGKDPVTKSEQLSSAFVFHLLTVDSLVGKELSLQSRS